MFPDGFTETQTLRRPSGSLSFATCTSPPVFWIAAQGFITPSLIRKELPIVEAFGTNHPDGWDYVVDTTRVSLIHPYNPVLLRHVRSLANNRRYIIIAPALIRFFGRLMSWLIRPTHIVGSAGEALEIIHGRVAKQSGKL